MKKNKVMEKMPRLLSSCKESTVCEVCKAHMAVKTSYSSKEKQPENLKQSRLIN